MYIYRFKAERANGTMLTGQVRANSQNEVINILKSKKLNPVFVDKKQAGFSFGIGQSVSAKDLVVFTRQLVFMISAGMPIMQSLQTIQIVTQSLPLKGVLNNLISNIDGGKSLSEAMAMHPTVFGNLFVSLVKSGETSGKLSLLLNQLADYMEENHKLKTRVKKAMWYPGLVLTIGVVIVVALLVYVVPKFVSIFESTGGELPLITQYLLTASNLFVNHFIVISIFVFVVPILSFMYLTSPAGRPMKDQLLLSLPIVGGIVKKNSLACLTRTLSYLLSAGVTVVDAMDKGAVSSNNYHIEKAVKRARARVERGKTITESLQAERIIPPLVGQMVSIGEETGNVDATLQKIAEFYEEQVKTTANAISELIQPVFIIVLGGIVGFVVIALYLPIFKLPGALGGM